MSTQFLDYETPGEEARGMNPRDAFRQLLPLLRRHRSRLVFSLALLVAATGLSLAWPWLIQQGIDGPLAGQLGRPAGERRFGPLLALGLAVLALQTGSLVLLYLQRIRLETVGQDVMLELKTRLFRHILSQDVSFFDRNPVGKLLARVESDAESLRLLFTNTVVLIVGDVLMIAGIWGLMLWKHTGLALVVFGSMPLIIVLVYTFHRMTTHRFLEVRRRMAEVTATLTEFLHGMSIVQIFHRGAFARQRVRRANESKFREDAYVNVVVCWFFNALFAMETVKVGLLLLLGAYWNVTPGIIVLFVLLIWKEFEPIARAADQLGSFQKGLAGARRIFSLLEEMPQIVDPALPVPGGALGRGIRFENVWFSYTDDGNWVLKDVSFEIERGRRVALVGVTGGGKSTVISLLLRLYDPQRGRITIDGVDIREMERADLRSRISLVLQDIFLFPGDVAWNISLGADGISRDQVESAAGTVSADRFIRRLPAGYETEVSEKGANFSRGERQLLSFARALVRNPDLLVLDEATSSVDPETEREIQESLKRLLAGRTSLIVAHRLSTILDADRILVMRNGRIVEQGAHEALLTNNGYYARLFALQFAGGNGEACHA